MGQASGRVNGETATSYELGREGRGKTWHVRRTKFNWVIFLGLGIRKQAEMLIVTQARLVCKSLIDFPDCLVRRVEGINCRDWTDVSGTIAIQTVNHLMALSL